MDKRLTVEGSPAAKMVQLMRKYGHNREMSIEVATVVTASPLSVKLSDGLVLQRSDLIVAESLLEHTRMINGNSATIGAVLKVNDKVIIIGDNDTQFYYVIDKAVM